MQAAHWQIYKIIIIIITRDFWILGGQNWTAAVTLLHALVATEGLGREQATEGWAGMRNPERSLERLVHFQGVEV